MVNPIEKKRPIFILAPMDDVTDTVFRQIVARCGRPDLFFTEFVNVDGLQSPGRPKLLKKIQYSKVESPIVAQIWGKNPDNFSKTAGELVEAGFSGVDINMGCPVKAIVKNGCCSALIDNRPLASKIIKATKKGVAGAVPVSVKTRIGTKDFDKGWIEFLLAHELDMLTIHGRTVKDMSKVPAKWELINEVRKLRDKISPRTKIVGNGDITSYAHGLELSNRYKLDGVMIGRGIFSDPFIFNQNSPWPDFTRGQKIDLFIKHIKLFVSTWGDNAHPVYVLNKFCKVYIQDFDGAKVLREKCMSVESTSELINILEKALLQ